MPTSGMVDFEDIASRQHSEVLVPSPYEGFNWSGVKAYDKSHFAGDPDGYEAAVHGHGAAYNRDGHKASFELASPGTFTLKSAHFAAAWNTGLTLTLTAFTDGVKVGTQTVILDQTDTLVTFDAAFSHITAVTIASSGGTHGTGFGEGTQVAFDNLKVIFDDASLSHPAAEPDHAALAAEAGFFGFAQTMPSHAMTDIWL